MSNSPNNPLKAALHTLENLRGHGHIALLAGGCVRDRLLGREPKDYDVVTDATPDRVRKLYPQARLVGAKFGVILIRQFGCDLEVATFRSDGTYSDGRHPDAITFGTPEEDARRRDFTINGLFYDPFEDRVIDYIDGQADLKAGVIRTIGDPDNRFEEDHLRMLRAIRFAARLNFSIEKETFAAIQRAASSLTSISPERIWMELELILTDRSRREGWRLLIDSGLRAWLSSSWPVDTEENKTIDKRLCALPYHVQSTSLVLASLFCDQTVKLFSQVGRGLRLSNRLLNDTSWMIQSLGFILEHEKQSSDVMELADLKLLMAHPCWADLLTLMRCHLVSAGESLDGHQKLSGRAEGIDPRAVSPPPLLTGDDLNAMGMSPGPRFGEVLNAVYRAQLNETIQNHDEAIAMVKPLSQS